MRIKLALTMGDAAGIGPEIIVKALAKAELYEQCLPVVIGDAVAIREAIAFTGSPLTLQIIRSVDEAAGQPGIIDLIDLGYLAAGSWAYKKLSALTGEAAFQYLKTAIEMTLAHHFDAIVTAPINKEAIHLAGHAFAGHTEILAHFTKTSNCSMLLAAGSLRVVHVTTHVAMADACRLITQERVYQVIQLARQSMQLFGLARPRIGVAGFNPHSSENGLFGTQEAEAIIPAIRQAQAEGLIVEGPVPPDTVFVKALAGQYDIVVAMYHDQGHIPIKLSGFKIDPITGRFTSVSGINCTIGLPFIRTSVDHGTAFDCAGDNVANAGSMIEAIEAAIIMTRNRAAQP